MIACEILELCEVSRVSCRCAAALFRFLRLSYLVSYVCLGNSCTWNSICPLGVNLCQTRGIRSTKSKSKSKTSLDLDIIKLCDMSVLWLTTYPLLFCIFQLTAHFFIFFIFTSTKSGENIDSSPVRLAPAAIPFPLPPEIDLHIEYDDGIIETRRVTRVKWILQT